MPRHPNRKSISKFLRFEVFKRDSFKCQYCGRSAPDVVLHADHVTPAADGGPTDLLNLITSCLDCNLGKGARALSDNSAVQKQRDTLEELQARREQLDMMLKWREGLQDLKKTTARKIADYWNELTPGWSVSEQGMTTINKWLRQHSADEILAAMDIAAEQYLERDAAGKLTSESWGRAFGKISGICRVTKLEKENPDLKELLYIRGILRNRLNYLDEASCLEYLQNARTWVVSIEQLRSIALSVTSWSNFKSKIGQAIQQTPAYRSEHSTDS